MIPKKFINYPFSNNGFKELAIRQVETAYEPLEEEIIKNEAIVLIDFKNDSDPTWDLKLIDAPNELIKKFKKIDTGNMTFSMDSEF